MTLHVIVKPLPLLFSIEFCRKLGLVLDTVENTATWKHINKVSELEELASGHLTVDILEYPEKGWKHPMPTGIFPKIHSGGPDRAVSKQADFECAATLLFKSNTFVLDPSISLSLLALAMPLGDRARRLLQAVSETVE